MARGLRPPRNKLLADRDMAEIEADAQKKLGIRHGGRSRWMAMLEVRFGEGGWWWGGMGIRRRLRGAGQAYKWCGEAVFSHLALKMRRILEYRYHPPPHKPYTSNA